MKQKSIHAVKDEHVSQLMAMSGVISVGVGKDTQGQPVILIGITNDDPGFTSTLPTELDGYKVEYRVLGSIKAQDSSE